MRIDYLSNHPGHAATLAAWHHAEWKDLYSDWSLETATAELNDHATRQTLPTSLVLLDGDKLLGSVSVVLEDAPDLQKYGSPWLASLFVTDDARGMGLGSALAEAAVELAALNDVPTLFLFTPEHEDFYAGLGWETVAEATLREIPVSVMSIVPVRHAG
jgi:predicted N-acetyltransferase YhbS